MRRLRTTEESRGWCAWCASRLLSCPFPANAACSQRRVDSAGAVPIEEMQTVVGAWTDDARLSTRRVRLSQRLLFSCRSKTRRVRVIEHAPHEVRIHARAIVAAHASELNGFLIECLHRDVGEG